MGLEEVFIDPKALPQGAGGLCQLTFLLVSYGYILFCASNMISDGSELLLLTPMAGLVGSVVLPVLGAVPDGAIVLFSGMGPDAQEQLGVGVGALAGSTIMLTTIPWFLSIFAGRVDIEKDRCTYRKPKLSGSKKLWTEQGVEPTGDVATGAKIMMITAASYFLIQGPAMFLHGPKEEVAEGESKWALAAMILCIFSFFAYLIYQYSLNRSGKDAPHELLIETVIIRKIKEGRISLLGALQAIMALHPTHFAQGELSVPLLDENGEDRLVNRLKSILGPFFYRYDIDQNGHIDSKELGKVMSDLGINARESDVDMTFRRFDVDGDNMITFSEFAKGVANMLRDPELQKKMLVTKAQALRDVLPTGVLEEGEVEMEVEEEDEEEMPEEFVDLPPAVQQRRIITRSCLLMGLGTALVLIFSDPMVGVMSEFGVRIGVPGFYVSFILAPLASNASELIASYSYALKKTSKSITISLSALTGAGAMNNTFTLGIFMMLIYTKSLAWQFTAETFSILVAELLVGCMAQFRVQKLWMALAVLMIYPLSLAMVFGMEAIGFD